MAFQQTPESKIVSGSDLDRLLAYWRFNSQSVVFSNGCFDILHTGHVDYLNRAASLGQVLIIGLNTDASVCRLKGPGRPINPQQARAVVLAALGCVDAVVFFDQDTPYELIKKIQPDILVKGADYKPEEVVGYDIVTAKGGQVISLELVPGFSTTDLESRIKGKS